MTSSTGIFFALLALCEGNPPVTVGFPSRRPMTRSFDIFFDLRLNKRLNKLSKCRWFETPSRSLWRHYNPLGSNSQSVRYPSRYAIPAPHKLAGHCPRCFCHRDNTQPILWQPLVRLSGPLTHQRFSPTTSNNTLEIIGCLNIQQNGHKRGCES